MQDNMKKTIFAVIFLGIISLSASKGFAQTTTSLGTAEWGQCEPYNKFCPLVRVAEVEDTTLPGSAAPALATLLRYYGKPEQGTGTIAKYTAPYHKITVPAIALKNFTYNYANMPLKLDSSTTDEQKDAIAELIFHCGAAVKTDFRKDTVTAYAGSIINAMATYFKFSRTAVELNHDYYSDRVWFDMIKKEIDNGRPVLAIGKRESGEKYVFIYDGYNSNSQVHVNWGWNGEDNGWFAVSEVHGYFDSDSAIFGLAPQAESESVELYLSQNISEGYTGISLSGTDYIESGKPFNVKLGYIRNDGTKDYDGPVKVSLLDRNGAIKCDISSRETPCKVAAGDSTGHIIECTISNTVLGDHICAYYKLADGTWNRLGAQKYGSPQTIGDMGVFDAPFIVIPDNLEEGNVYYPTLVPGHKTPIVIGWTYDGEDLLDGFVTLSKGEHTISAAILYVPVSSTADWEKVGGEIVTKKIKVN